MSDNVILWLTLSLRICAQEPTDRRTADTWISMTGQMLVVTGFHQKEY